METRDRLLFLAFSGAPLVLYGMILAALYYHYKQTIKNWWHMRKINRTLNEFDKFLNSIDRSHEQMDKLREKRDA